MTGSQRLQKRPHSSTYPLIMSHVVCEGSSVANCDAVIVAPEYIVRGTKHMSSHIACCRGPVAPWPLSVTTTCQRQEIAPCNPKSWRPNTT